MAKLDHIKGDLLAEVKRRSLQPGADAGALIEDLKAEPGSRVLYSEGEGEVSLLVPVRDGYEGPDRVRVAPLDNPTNVIDDVQRSRTVEVEGFGKFHEFVLTPLAYKKKAASEIGLQGTSKGGEYWSPLGFEDGWFSESLKGLIELSVQGGVAVHPLVEDDARDKTHKKLSSEERRFMQLVLGREVGAVAHESDIRDALRKFSDEDGMGAGAVRSLTIALTGEAKTLPPGEGVETALQLARPALEKILGGATAFDAKGFPEALIRVAESTLSEIGAKAEAGSLKTLLQGKEVADELVAAALDRAFGAGFTSERRPTLQLVDRVIDGFGEKLAPQEVEALRTLREEIDYQFEADLFGSDLAQKPLSTKSADAKLKQIAEHLGEGTEADPAALAALAWKLAAALNVPSKRPSLIVVTGEGGTGADVVFDRAKTLLGEGLVDIQGGTDLRMSDPVGVLVGSPADEPGIARGVWVHDAPSGNKPFLAAIDGLESLGKACTQPEETAAAVRSFWSFAAQVERDGWFKGYDPNDTAKALGAKVDLAKGVLLLRTSQTPAELEKTLPADVWAKVSSRIVDLSTTNADSTIAAATKALEKHMTWAFGLSGAEVQLSESARSFFTDLLSAGMKPKQLQELAIDQISPKLYFAAVDGELVPKVRVELARGLTGKERARLKESWLAGKVCSLAGLGGSVFSIYDAGTAAATSRAKLSPKIERAIEEKKELERLRLIVAEYQLGALSDEKKIAQLIDGNRKSHKSIEQLKWLNERAVWEIEDLQRLNSLAQKTIANLQGDLQKANGRIEQQNATIGTLKDAGVKLEAAAKKAIAERDQIDATLKLVENQFDQAIQQLSSSAASLDPLQVFALIRQGTQQPGGSPYLDPLLRQMFAVATARALERAAGHARNFNKWQEITQLANAYLTTSAALGAAVDPTVLAGFERTARLSGNGWSRNLGRDWRDDVGLPPAGGETDELLLSYLTRNVLRSLGVRT